MVPARVIIIAVLISASVSEVILLLGAASDEAGCRRFRWSSRDRGAIGAILQGVRFIPCCLIGDGIVPVRAAVRSLCFFPFTRLLKISLDPSLHT